MTAPKMQVPRPGDRAMTAGIAPPDHADCAAVWPASTRIPTTPSRPHPAFWLMGCHGGAGVTTLEALLSPAGDSQRAWPAHSEQSPFVLLVAAETASGLEKAHLVLRQYHAGLAGRGNRLLGLVTVAPLPGRRPASIKQARDLLSPLALNMWEVPFVAGYRELLPGDLPTWSPGDPLPERRRRSDPRTDIPPGVADMGADLVELVVLSYRQERSS